MGILIISIAKEIKARHSSDVYNTAVVKYVKCKITGKMPYHKKPDSYKIASKTKYHPKKLNSFVNRFPATE